MLKMANELASLLQPRPEFQSRSLTYIQTLSGAINGLAYGLSGIFKTSRYQNTRCLKDAEHEVESSYFPLKKGDALTPLTSVPVGGTTLGSIYSKLSEKGQFRLLEVLPGKPGTMLECRLHVCSIRSNHDSYEALSYCWREEKSSAHDPQRRHHVHDPKIQCNGVLMEVGINLHLALHQLRYETSPRVVWADAVCINQGDLEERSEQVALMGEIFHEAYQVVVWLGPEPACHRGNGVSASDDNDEVSSQAFAMVCSIVNTWARETGNVDLGRPQYRRQGSVQDVYDLIPLDKPHWEKLKPLFSNSWLTRMWVVQEIALARRATVIWAKSEISWELIGLAAAIVRTNWEYIGPWGAHNGIGSNQVPVGVMNAYLMYRISSFQSNLAPLCLSFCELLALTKQFECQEKHDKIYALLGLETSDRAKFFITVDYSRPVDDLYRSVALAILRSSKPLEILAYVHHKEIPNILRSDEGGKSNSNRDNPSSTGESVSAITPQRSLPALSGVSHVGISYDTKDTNLANYKHDAKEIVPSYKPNSSVTAPESWVPRWDIDQPQTLAPLEGYLHLAAGLYRPVSIRDIEATSKGDPLVVRGVVLDSVRCKGSIPMTLEYTDSSERPPQTGPTRDGLENIAWTLSAGKDWYGIAVASPSQPLADFADCLRRGFLWWALSQDAFGPSIEDEGLRKANCDVDTKFVSNVPSGNQGITLRELEVLSMTGDGDRFMDATIAACTGRSLFTTSTGVRGLGPASTQPGDKVCIIFGASVPFIIRECKGDQGYRLIGECYIHDLMGGQARMGTHEHTWIKLV